MACLFCLLVNFDNERKQAKTQEERSITSIIILFTESVPMPIQTISCNVRFCVVCCTLGRRQKPRELVTSDVRAYC